MSIWELIVIAVGLSMDAFAVSSAGTVSRKGSTSTCCLRACTSVGFQN